MVESSPLRHPSTPQPQPCPAPVHRTLFILVRRDLVSPDLPTPTSSSPACTRRRSSVADARDSNMETGEHGDRRCGLLKLPVKVCLYIYDCTYGHNNIHDCRATFDWSSGKFSGTFALPLTCKQIRQEFPPISLRIPIPPADLPTAPKIPLRSVEVPYVGKAAFEFELGG